MSRVLWFGDAGCHTGFARVTHAIGDRLVSDYGHDVHCLAVNHQGDYWDTKIKLYRPTKLLERDVYGKSRVIEMLGKVMPHVIVMLNDPAEVLGMLFNNGYDKDLMLAKYGHIISYLPIDGHNHPPAWRELETYTTRVAMTKYGQSFMPEAPLIYHGVDTNKFWPVAEKPIVTSTDVECKTKADCKVAFGYSPDSFLVLRVDRNSGRKDFPATWSALLPVMHRHSDIVVHFHCQGRGDAMGVDIPAVWSRDPTTRNRFYLPDMQNSFLGWDERDLNCLYNAADLFVTTSRGEGFGLTIAEALACGVPVIAQNVSAIPEVVGPGGILIEPQREITVPSGQDVWLADIEAFSEAIEALYLSRSKRRKLGKAGTEHIRTSFSWDTAAKMFHELIGELSSNPQGELAHGETAFSGP